MPLPLRDLMKVLAIAEHGSVSQAARVLHIAQPALSKTISSVESYLQVTLFTRDHAGVKPTREGELLLARARAIQGELNRVERDIEAVRKRGERRIVIGVVPIHPIDQQTRAILAVMEQFPNMSLGIDPDSMENLIDKLAAGTIDFIFAPLPEKILGPAFIEEPVYWEQLVVACGPQSPLFSHQKPTPHMVRDQPWVVGPEGSVSHGRLLEFCRAHRLAIPRIALEVDVVPARRAAVEYSTMLSIFQYAQVYTPTKSGDIRALPLIWPHKRRAIGTLRSSSSPSDIHDCFVGALRAVFAADGLPVVK